MDYRDSNVYFLAVKSYMNNLAHIGICTFTRRSGQKPFGACRVVYNRTEAEGAISCTKKATQRTIMVSGNTANPILVSGT